MTLAIETEARRQAAAKSKRDPIRVVRFLFRVASWFVRFAN